MTDIEHYDFVLDFCKRKLKLFFPFYNFLCVLIFTSNKFMYYYSANSDHLLDPYEEYYLIFYLIKI